ncbi:iron-siderophore ABC transporter substrate-binding protein [Nocardiopsis sp. RSe5-2]|uniref:Iron-siderophore ABC transporter substrate-binding protein n=1 Tax=Nocardiopsis endophytica TaxID=3018445 RepID=A0ABT4U4S4_9ACTN|nr:iron-siderophore ABC transporter substrate-binding protein [Nocardiopsis endophytica]MDA2811332.1 iron-siderophore ABC transporter substrate-binding protein [Nocardiopsis endophytica]
MTRALIAVPAAALALALTTAGCGAAGDRAGTSGGGGNGGGAVTLEHTLGELELDAPATDVVALEWTYAEDLQALGVTPAGVADVEGYDQWVTAGPRFDEGVEDVGTRDAPSLESIRALDPDLIITSELRSGENLEQLQDIAPTLVFDPYAADGEYAEMRATFATIGTAVGKEDEAQEVLDGLDARLEELKGELADAGADGAEVTVARGYTADGAAVVELLTDSTVPGALLGELGLANAWTADADAYGMSKVDVEGLTEVEDSHLVYVAAEDDNVFTGDLDGNELWQDLEFVEEDRVHALDPGTWYFGGPLSSRQVAEEITAALTA